MGRGGCAEAPGGAKRRRGREPRSGLGDLGSHLCRLPSVPPARRFQGEGGEEEPRVSPPPSRSASIPAAGAGVSEPPESRRARPGGERRQRGGGAAPVRSPDGRAGPCARSGAAVTRGISASQAPSPHRGQALVCGSGPRRGGGAGRAVRGARGRSPSRGSRRSRGMGRKGGEGIAIRRAGHPCGWGWQGWGVGSLPAHGAPGPRLLRAQLHRDVHCMRVQHTLCKAGCTNPHCTSAGYTMHCCSHQCTAHIAHICTTKMLHAPHNSVLYMLHKHVTHVHSCMLHTPAARMCHTHNVII